MDLAIRCGDQDRAAISVKARARRSPSLPTLLGGAAIVACGAVLCAGPALGDAPRKDLWQTYMEAALASDQTDDFAVEAITLRIAMATAYRQDPTGPRPVLTRLPLILVYGELDRPDLQKPLSAQGLHMDFSQPDKGYDDYIETIDSFAPSYYDRRAAHARSDSHDGSQDPRQADRARGANESYRIEVALRAKLRPGDQIGLATAMSQVGLAYVKMGDLNCGGYDYGRAFEMFRASQTTNGAMVWAGGLFSVEDPAGAAGQFTAGQTERDLPAYTALLLGRNMMTLAYETLDRQRDDASSEKQDLATCDNFGPPARTQPPIGFDAQVKRATEYYDAVKELTRDLWSDHPFIGLFDSHLANLYDLEFQWSKAHPGQYRESLAQARKAYEASLAILTRADGKDSDGVRAVAATYRDLLVKADLTHEARKVEETYGLTSSNAGK